MEEILSEYLGRGIALPIIVAFVGTGFMRYCLGQAWGNRATSSAVFIAFLVGYTLIFTWPGFPPISSMQKLAFIVLFGGVIGFVLDIFGNPKVFRSAVLVITPVLITGWLGWRQLNSFEPTDLVTLAVMAAIGIIIFYNLASTNGEHSSPTIMALVAAVGASGVALLGASGSIAQQFGIMAAALGGFLLWNWPVSRYAFGLAAVLGAGGGIVALAVSMALFTDSNRIAVAVLMLAFLARPVAEKLPLAKSKGIGPIVLGLTSAVPAAIAVAIAFAAAEN